MFADQFAPGGEISLHNNHKSRSYSYHVPESEDRQDGGADRVSDDADDTC